MKRRVLVITGAVLTVVALLAGGCVSPEVTEPEDEVLSPEDAFDVAVAWLQQVYPDRAPAEGILWTVEDVVVRGADGEPLLGAAQKRIVSDDWTARVSWAVVAPDFLTYTIELKSATLGWYWEGMVKAVGGAVTEDVEMQKMTQELASGVAKRFVEASPTYTSSGMDETLKLVETRDSSVPFGWVFVFEFDSRHAGYGDPSDQPVLPVITPHRAVVTVETMQVTEAVMDGRWDMMAQEFIAVTEDAAREVAHTFVLSSPTFTFDGISETLELVRVDPKEADDAWTFVFRFDSRHFGYGDRTGEPLLTVITPHEAVVTVAGGVVTSAIMDGAWDMLLQELVKVTEESSRGIAASFVRNSPTFAFDGIPATLELVETLYPDIENAWTFVFQFESAHAGYGDRTGQMLAEVITPHEAHVTVEDGRVVSALMDEQWDMLAQEMVS